MVQPHDRKVNGMDDVIGTPAQPFDQTSRGAPGVIRSFFEDVEEVAEMVIKVLGGIREENLASLDQLDEEDQGSRLIQGIRVPDAKVPGRLVERWDAGPA